MGRIYEEIIDIVVSVILSECSLYCMDFMRFVV